MWEYRLESDISIDSLNILGEQGWETFWIFSKTALSPYFKYYLKRNLQTETIGEGNPVGNFTIKKDFSYGEITQIYILGFISFVILFYVLKKIFTHEAVDILNFKRNTKEKV